MLGGDYVTFGNRRYVEPVAELLAPLAGAPCGSYAVLGNHDDDRDMPAALTRHGFTVLRISGRPSRFATNASTSWASATGPRASRT